MMNGNSQGRGNEPAERVVDLFVHMPIGFAVMAWKRVPDFVVSVPGLVNEALSKGCAQLAQAEERLSEEVRKARMIGQVAVTFGGRQLRREVDARLRDARQTAGGLASFLPGPAGGGGEGSNGAAGRTAEPVAATAAPARTTDKAPAKATRPPAKATRPPAAKTAKTAKATKATKATKPTRPTKTTKAAKSSGPAETATTPAGSPAPTPASAADLPIREYDGLSASQVVSRLTGLAPGELHAVRAYEDATRGRRTVLLAIDRLLAGSEEAGTAS